MTDSAQKYLAIMNRLCKWRSVFAGWQLGTRADTDGESNAVRDHRDATLACRVEVSAVTHLLIEKGVFTYEEFVDAIGKEADHQHRAFEQLFRGVKATTDGLDIDVQEFAKTTKRMNFPP